MGVDGPVLAGGAAAPRPHPLRSPAGAVSAPLVLGFAVASIGGPVALVYQLLPDVVGTAALPSLGLVVLVALALFAFPLTVWWRFSGRIASAGGLYGFVEAAAGRTPARIHGAIWTVSYFLYLPATVTWVVYELLPALAPGLTPYRSTLQLALPVAFAAAVLAPLRVSLPPVFLLAAFQVGLLLVLGSLEIERVGFPLSAFAPHGNAGALARGGATGSLLFLCASLPLYLGAEVRGGGIALRRSIVAGTGIVGAATLFAAVPLASVAASDRGGELPASTLARAYGGHALGVAAGTATVLSILALVFAEYLALTRLLPAATGISTRSAALGIGVVFLAVDGVSLLDPDRAYDSALRPSLAALYLSQLVVFGVYPRFEGVRRRLPALAVAAVAAAPMVWGLYLVLADKLAS